MRRVLLTDGDRFPFSAGDLRLLADARVALDEVAGRDRDAVTRDWRRGARPHSAAFTQEAFDELRRTALLDVLHVLRGEQPRFPMPGPGVTAQAIDPT